MSGLYIHIPFCERKCIYCDFYSIEDRSSIDRFLEALTIEMSSTASLVGELRFETIFIGGGTPSLLNPAQLKNIFRTIAAHYSLSDNLEITLEANPGTVTIENLSGYRALGINRISFGIQSFHADELRFLGRIHSAEQAVESIGLAREAGFSTISVDMMTSLPGQTVQRLEQSLERALALEPQHISVYNLIVEKGTPLHRMVESGEAVLVTPDQDAALYEFTMEFLEMRGFEHYEVSNYARPGFRSRHNSNYWNHSPYRGFGPSAHSFLSPKRWWNIPDVGAYCDRLLRGESAIIGEEILDGKQLVEEAIFLGLRSDGLDLGRLTDHYGFAITSPVRSLIDRWIGDGLAVQEGERLRLTSRGYQVCDELCLQMIGIE